MSYPRNNASPERIAVGAVVQISDGAVQTSGVSISVRGQGGASGAGAGTTAYDNGIVQYTPTQAETDYTSFVVVAYKTGCIPASVTVVTSASGTPGVVVVPSTQKVDVETIKTQTVTCVAGVTVSPYVGATGAAINGTNANTLSGHDPGATLGTSTLTQAQVTGGAYALNHASFAFNAALDFTTAQKEATLARVTLVDTTTTNTDMRGTDSAALASTFSGITSLAQWLGAMAGAQTANATALTEINATGAGSGTYSATFSLERVHSDIDTLPYDVWHYDISGVFTTGQAGYYIAGIYADAASIVATIGTAGAGLTALAPASTALSTATWTATRAGYLDNLSGGAVMLAASYSAPPSAATISTQVASDLAAAHGAGSWATATGFSTLDAAGVRAAVGLATANLDAQLADLPTVAEFEARTLVAANYGTAASQATIISTLGTAGAGLTDIPDPLVSTSGTATAGGASTITLAVGTAGGDDYYVRQAVMLTGGTGAGQTNRITAYNSGTRVATVADAWVTQPDNTTTYKVLGRTE